MRLEDYIKDLNPELQERARACGSAEELLALAKEAKVPVPDEALEAIAGGNSESVNCGRQLKCPKCGSTDIRTTVYFDYVDCVCEKCGYEWAD